MMEIEDDIFLILESESDFSSEFVVIDEVGADNRCDSVENVSEHPAVHPLLSNQEVNGKLYRSKQHLRFSKCLEIHLQKIDISDYGGSVSSSRYLSEKSFEKMRHKEKKRVEKCRRERERRRLRKLFMHNKSTKSSFSQLNVQDKKQSRTEKQSEIQNEGCSIKSPFSFSDGFKIPQRAANFQQTSPVHHKDDLYILRQSTHSQSVRGDMAFKRKHSRPLHPSPKKESHSVVQDGLPSFVKHKKRDEVKRPLKKVCISMPEEPVSLAQFPDRTVASKKLKKRRVSVSPGRNSCHQTGRLKRPKRTFDFDPAELFSVSDIPRNVTSAKVQSPPISTSSQPQSLSHEEKKEECSEKNSASGQPVANSLKCKRHQERPANQSSNSGTPKFKLSVEQTFTVQQDKLQSPQSNISPQSNAPKNDQLQMSAKKEKHKRKFFQFISLKKTSPKKKCETASSGEKPENKESSELELPEKSDHEHNMKQRASTKNTCTANDMDSVQLIDCHQDKDDKYPTEPNHDRNIEEEMAMDSAYRLKLSDSIRTLQIAIELNDEVDDDLAEVPILCGEFKVLKESPLGKPKKQKRHGDNLPVPDTTSVCVQSGDNADLKDEECALDEEDMCTDPSCDEASEQCDKDDVNVNQELKEKDVLNSPPHQDSADHTNAGSRKRVRIADEAVVIADNPCTSKSFYAADPPFFLPKSVLKNPFDQPPSKKKKCLGSSKYLMKEHARKKLLQHLVWSRKRKAGLEQERLLSKRSKVVPKKHEPLSTRERLPSLKMLESLENGDLFRRRSRRKQIVELLDIGKEDTEPNKTNTKTTTARRKHVLSSRKRKKANRQKKMKKAECVDDTHQDEFQQGLVRYNPRTDCRRSWRKRRDNPVIQSRGCQTGKGPNDDPLSDKTHFYNITTPLYYRGLRGAVPVQKAYSQTQNISQMSEVSTTFIESKKLEQVTDEQLWLLVDPVKMETSSRCVPLCSELSEVIQKRNRCDSSVNILETEVLGGKFHSISLCLIILFRKLCDLQSLNIAYPHNLHINYLIISLQTLGKSFPQYSSLARRQHRVAEYVNHSRGFTFYILGCLVKQIHNLLREIHTETKSTELKKAIEACVLMSVYVRLYLGSRCQTPTSFSLKSFKHHQEQLLQYVSKPECFFFTDQEKNSFSSCLKQCKEQIAEAEKKVQNAIKRQFDVLEHLAIESQLTFASSTDSSDCESEPNEMSARTDAVTCIPKRRNPEISAETLEAKTAMISTFFHFESFLSLKEVPGTFVDSLVQNTYSDRRVVDVIDNKLQSMINRYTERTDSPLTSEKKDKMRLILLQYYVKHIQSILSGSKSTPRVTVKLLNSTVKTATLPTSTVKSSESSHAQSRKQLICNSVPFSKSNKHPVSALSETVTGRLNLSAARHVDRFTSISQMILEDAVPLKSVNPVSMADTANSQMKHTNLNQSFLNETKVTQTVSKILVGSPSHNLSCNAEGKSLTSLPVQSTSTLGSSALAPDQESSTQPLSTDISCTNSCNATTIVSKAIFTTKTSHGQVSDLLSASALSPAQESSRQPLSTDISCASSCNAVSKTISTTQTSHGQVSDLLSASALSPAQESGRQPLSADISCASSCNAVSKTISTTQTSHGQVSDLMSASPLSQASLELSSNTVSSPSITLKSSPSTVRPDSALKVKFQPAVSSSVQSQCNSVRSLPGLGCIVANNETTLSLLRRTLATAESIYPQILQRNLAVNSLPYVHPALLVFQQQTTSLCRNHISVTSTKQAGISLLQNAVPGGTYAQTHTLPGSISRGPQCRPTASLSNSRSISSIAGHIAFNVGSFNAQNASSLSTNLLQSTQPPVHVLQIPLRKPISTVTIQPCLLPVLTNTVAQTSIPNLTREPQVRHSPRTTIVTSLSPLPVSTFTTQPCVWPVLTSNVVQRSVPSLLEPRFSPRPTIVTSLSPLQASTASICRSCETRISFSTYNHQVKPVVSKPVPLCSICAQSLNYSTIPVCDKVLYTSGKVNVSVTKQAVTAPRVASTSILSSKDVENILARFSNMYDIHTTPIARPPINSPLPKSVPQTQPQSQSLRGTSTSSLASASVLSSKEVDNIHTAPRDAILSSKDVENILAHFSKTLVNVGSSVICSPLHQVVTTNTAGRISDIHTTPIARPPINSPSPKSVPNTLLQSQSMRGTSTSSLGTVHNGNSFVVSRISPQVTTTGQVCDTPTSSVAFHSFPLPKPAPHVQPYSQALAGTSTSLLGTILPCAPGVFSTSNITSTSSSCSFTTLKPVASTTVTDKVPKVSTHSCSLIHHVSANTSTELNRNCSSNVTYPVNALTSNVACKHSLNAPFANGTDIIHSTSSSALPSLICSQAPVSSTVDHKNCVYHLPSSVPISPAFSNLISSTRIPDVHSETACALSDLNSSETPTTICTTAASVSTLPLTSISKFNYGPSRDRLSSSSSRNEENPTDETIPNLEDFSTNERNWKHLFNSQWHKVNVSQSNQADEGLVVPSSEPPSDAFDIASFKMVQQSTQNHVHTCINAFNGHSSLQSSDKHSVESLPSSVGVILPSVLPCKLNFDARVVKDTLLLKWNLNKQDKYLEMDIQEFEICYARLPDASWFTVDGCCNASWASMGVIKALPLPMSATLTNLHRTRCYVFIVKGILSGGKKSIYSDIKLVEIDKH